MNVSQFEHSALGLMTKSVNSDKCESVDSFPRMK